MSRSSLPAATGSQATHNDQQFLLEYHERPDENSIGDGRDLRSRGMRRPTDVADRPGHDGIDESFTAQMIVSASDLAPDVPGEQNLWVQGVGCGSAVVHFSA